MSFYGSLILVDSIKDRMRFGFDYLCTMKQNEQFRQFIREHASDDPMRLLLSASNYPDVDVPFAVEQLLARRQIKEKLPTWYQNDALLFPAKITAEQCSSEQTALYKQRLVKEDEALCDLTGGLGIDSYYFSRKVRSVTYIERFPAYCEAAKANFEVLGAGNIKVLQGDAAEWIGQMEGIDLFYIDPARRGEGNRRLFALHDCEPDLTKLLPLLLQRAPKVIAKLSPMADIQMTLEQLPGTREIHVLSVRNECKELLFVVEGGETSASIPIHCIHFDVQGGEQSFTFTLTEEQQAQVSLASAIGSYLYEPNASLLKAGAFKSIAARLHLQKLHISSHLYTSDQPVMDFPGRIFQIEEVIPFHNKVCKQLPQSLPQANITVRNFPLSVDALRKKTRIREGGSVYLFATTLASGEKVLVKGSKCR